MSAAADPGVRPTMMGKRDHEKAIFEAFLRIEPLFGGESIAGYDQPANESDFPDVICRSASNRRIGVELGEWLHQGEMAFAKKREATQQVLLSAIGEQGSNFTKPIDFVWLRPKASIKLIEAVTFRQELFDCIGHADHRWPSERFWHSSQGHCIKNAELEPYPTLAKYLDGIQLFPRETSTRPSPSAWPDGMEWITFPAPVGVFDNDTMIRPLLSLLGDKKRHYGQTGTGFDHLSLVAYFNQGLYYNSPIDTPHLGLGDIVERVRHTVGGDRGPFQSIYVFEAVDGGRVFRVC